MEHFGLFLDSFHGGCGNHVKGRVCGLCCRQHGCSPPWAGVHGTWPWHPRPTWRPLIRMEFFCALLSQATAHNNSLLFSYSPLLMKNLPSCTPLLKSGGFFLPFGQKSVLILPTASRLGLGTSLRGFSPAPEGGGLLPPPCTHTHIHITHVTHAHHMHA